MKTGSIIMAGCFLMLFSCQKDQDHVREIGKLHLSIQHPQPGDILDLSYDPGEINEEDEIEAYFHYFVGPKAYPEDLQIRDSAGILKAKMVIPDSATAIAFNFEKNGIVDNNDKKGYFLPLYNSTGTRLPGSLANEGYFYNNMTFQYEVQNDSTLVLVEQDLKQNPSLEKDWEGIYSRMLHASNKEKGKDFMKKRLSLYSKKKDLTDDEYYNITGFYYTMENEKAADSVLELGKDMYPAGRVSEWYYVNKFRKEKDEDKREEIIMEFAENLNGSSNSGKDYMAQNLAAKYGEERNWEKFKIYSGFISETRDLGNLHNNVARSLAEKGEDLEKAQELSERSLQFLTEGQKPEYFSTKQHEKNVEYNQNMFLDTYSLILFKQGKLNEAIENQEKAVADGKNSEYNERYLQYLLANKEYKKAEKKGAGFISSYNATGKAKEYYEEAFTKSLGSGEDLERRLIELNQKGYEKILAKTRMEMLDEEAPGFELADLEGNSVTLGSLTGKTVILDFWATWCGPCTASFPGMQMAVNKFEKDDTVQFLFVNTFEKGPDLKKEIGEFLKENKYSFHVLMDEQQEGTNKYKTALAYNVRGIPTKVIIGPDGKLSSKN